MKKYHIDGERPWEYMTEEERESWYERTGVRKRTEEERTKAIEDYYRRFPEEREKDRIFEEKLKKREKGGF